MKKLVFASDQLPPALDDQARFSLWRDIYTSHYGDAEISRLDDRPFSSRSEFAQIGDVGVLKCESTFQRNARTARHAAADTRGDFVFGILRGQASIAIAQRGREHAAAPGQVTFYTNAEAFESRAEDDTSFVGLCMPRARLLERVANADDLVISPLDPTLPALRHLGRYMDFLLACDELADDPRLGGRLRETLLDLVALTLGANGEIAEMARSRGLRAARIHDIVADISTRFADPSMSPHDVARKLGLSARYVQDLLQETGVSFTERVVELRLQKARAMLASPEYDRLKVSDIAFACGFGNVSYFNQRFRRRFGDSPTQCRGGGRSV
jgi:AraC-like DNA-binding protein